MDSIRFKCECGKEFSVPGSLVGKKGRCPSCGSLVVIPARPSAPESPQGHAPPAAASDSSSAAGPDIPIITPVFPASGASVPYPPPLGPPVMPPYAGPYPPPPPMYAPPYGPPGFFPTPMQAGAASRREQAEPESFYIPPSLAVSVGGCIKEAWGVIKDSVGHFIAASAIYLAFVWGLVWLPYFIGWGIFAFIAPPFFAGMNYFCLKKLRGQAARPGDVFKGFKLYTKSLGAFLFIYLPVACGSIPAIIMASTGGRLPGGTAVQGGVEWIIAAIPAAILLAVTVIYSFTYFFIVDRGMEPWRAMVSSWRMVKRAGWRVPAILLLTYLSNLAGFMLLLVGLCVTVPLSFVALASVYHRLSLACCYTVGAGEKDSQDKEELHPLEEGRPSTPHTQRPQDKAY